MNHDPLPEETPRRARSALSPMRYRLLIAVMVLAAAMIANTLYLLANRLTETTGYTLFAITDESLPKLYQVMVLSHTGVGLVLAGLATIFALWHLGPVWKRRRPRTVVTGLLVIAGIATLAISGLFILTAAATRQHAWVWWLHVAVAAGLPAVYLLHRLWSMRPPAPATIRSFWLATAALTLAAVGVHTLLPRGIQLTPEARAARATTDDRAPSSLVYYAQRRPAAPPYFIPVSQVPIESIFFPAASTTTTGGLLPDRILLQEYANRQQLPPDDFKKFGFNVSAKIGAEGCARCHPDVVEQWAASAHRFASFNNPFYEATINDLRKNATRENPPILAHLEHFGIPKSKLPFVRSKWCSGCHDPALMIPGRMTDEIDRTSAAAQAGLTCLACHSIDAIHNNTGNGHYNIADEQEDPYLFSSHYTGIRSEIHEMAIRARPEVHKRRMLKPFFRTSEFCSVCHKVNLDVPVNTYRWFRGQNEYDNWHDSGVAHNASRTFYLPPARRVCQECHMPPEPAIRGDFAAKNGMVRSHRFLAVNTALPFIRGDSDTIRRIEEFLRDDKLRVDVFALRVLRDGADPQTIYAPDLARPTIPAERTIHAEVVVRNRNVGHTFPGGTNDSNEGWIEFSVLDERGELLGRSGGVGPDGHVDPDAHFYRVVMLDREGRKIHRRDAQNIYVPVYVRVIGPGAANVAHYEFTPSKSLAGRRLTLRARLLWRKFDRLYTEFAFHNNRQAFALFDDVPDLPVTEIERSEITFTVGPAAMPEPVVASAVIPESDWMRMNDYGIALLLEGNTRAAAEAFQRVVDIAPGRVDGHRNLARAFRTEGLLARAYDALRKAEEIAPADPISAWVWGQVLAEDGRYGEAAAAYRRVLQSFPSDRAAWRELAVVGYRDHRFDDAIAAADEVLNIDPEDRIAHYYRMLALKALGRDAEAGQARLAYETYQIDESAQEVTRAYRLQSPGDNNESQPIHTHRVELRGQPASVADAAENHHHSPG